MPGVLRALIGILFRIIGKNPESQELQVFNFGISKLTVKETEIQTNRNHVKEGDNTELRNYVTGNCTASALRSIFSSSREFGFYIS